ncbi:PREDICTED: uncharacterized protein LOC106150156, partial [Chinchilla lanigera]|uniref:uncharacterized protein LOC106150156 n=1 Tax=Chinchilla lanigera TaxID=34839 RepID=UPI000696CADA
RAAAQVCGREGALAAAPGLPHPGSRTRAPAPPPLHLRACGPGPPPTSGRCHSPAARPAGRGRPGILAGGGVGLLGFYERGKAKALRRKEARRSRSSADPEPTHLPAGHKLSEKRTSLFPVQPPVVGIVPSTYCVFSKYSQGKKGLEKQAGSRNILHLLSCSFYLSPYTFPGHGGCGVTAGPLSHLTLVQGSRSWEKAETNQDMEEKRSKGGKNEGGFDSFGMPRLSSVGETGSSYTGGSRSHVTVTLHSAAKVKPHRLNSDQQG